jgi:hypothetical protein
MKMLTSLTLSANTPLLLGGVKMQPAGANFGYFKLQFVSILEKD